MGKGSNRFFDFLLYQAAALVIRKQRAQASENFRTHVYLQTPPWHDMRNSPPIVNIIRGKRWSIRIFSFRRGRYSKRISSHLGRLPQGASQGASCIPPIPVQSQSQPKFADAIKYIKTQHLEQHRSHKSCVFFLNSLIHGFLLNLFKDPWHVLAPSRCWPGPRLDISSSGRAARRLVEVVCDKI